MKRMDTKKITVLIMAAGTGGHVFPALSIVESLRKQSVNVEWLGTHSGMENSLLAATDIPLHQISIKGLRGSGLVRKLTSPFMLCMAFFQSFNVIRRVRPDCVLGMGGFICGPAGLAAKLLRKPLLIHEQNAVAGLTNNLLSKVSTKVFEAFPNTFNEQVNAVHTGNPLRAEIFNIDKAEVEVNSNSMLKLLVLGGSQGSASINKVIPEIAANWTESGILSIRHQTGGATLQETAQHYQKLGIQLNNNLVLEPFINDMASAYKWADIVICRSGASTVSELAAIGLPSILVPYPHHKDQQQLLNAQWLANNGAASVVTQADFSVKTVLPQLVKLQKDRNLLKEIGAKAKRLSINNAGEIIASECVRAANA